MGISYSSQLDDGTFNDSEALLWDVALTLEGKQERLKAYGGIAFVVAKVVDNEVTHLYLAKNPGRPLNLYREKDGVLISSEGIGDGIDDHKLYTYNYRLNRMTTKHFRVPTFDPEAPDYAWNARSTYSPPATSTVPSYLPKRYGNEYAKEGVDYWIDRDGEVIYFDDEEWETKPLMSAHESLIAEENRAGKTEEDMTLEEYDQSWFLNDYLESNNQEYKAYSVYADYMTRAYGVYDDAWDLIDTDISYFAAQAKTAKRDLILDLLRGALEMVFSQPGYHDMRSFDPFFVQSAVTDKKRQAAVPLGATAQG
jgi:hypothetical protein